MSHSADTPPAAPRPPRDRRTWPWIVAVLVAVVAIVVGVSVASSMMRSDDAPAPIETSAPDSTPSSAPPTSVPTPTSTATPRAELTDDDLDAIEDAVQDAAFADLYDYLAEPVHVTIAASDFDSDRSRDNAVIDLEYLADAGEWNWDLDDSTIAGFRAGAYAQHFAAGTIVGESSDDYVVSFEVAGGEIVGVFLSNSSAVVSS